MTATIEERLKSAREELELEVTQAELAYIKNQRSLAEAARFAKFQEIGTDIGDRQGFLFDQPGFRSDPRIYGGYVSRLEDRLEGRNEPFFRDETELAELRGEGRVLGCGNEAGVGVVRVLKNFSVGTGYEYDYSPVEESDEDLSQAVQNWNDEFDMRVKWTQAERETMDRAPTDGETFIQLDPIGGGRADICFREPDAITEPRSKQHMDEYVGAYALDWSFGIATKINKPTAVHGYFVDETGDQRDYDWIPESRMVHYKRNVVRNVKRGLTDFFAPGQSLRRASKILRNTGEGAALQSAIAWIREHPAGTTASQVINMTGGKSEIEIDRTTAEGNTRTHRFQRYLPGTILDVRAGQAYKAGPMGDGANFIDVSAAILSYAGIRWNMPDWLIRSDSSSSNFASVLVTESPFTKSMEVEQVDLKAVFMEVKWKMLDMAVRNGRFYKWGIRTLSELKSRIQMNIIMPRVTTRNRLEETKMRSMLHEYGLISKQSWSAKEELNYEHEQAALTADPGVPQISMAMDMAQPDGQNGGRPGVSRNGGILRKAGLDVGLSDKEFQPQAGENGNVNQMKKK